MEMTINTDDITLPYYDLSLAVVESDSLNHRPNVCTRSPYWPPIGATIVVRERQYRKPSTLRRFTVLTAGEMIIDEDSGTPGRPDVSIEIQVREEF